VIEDFWFFVSARVAFRAESLPYVCRGSLSRWQIPAISPADPQAIRETLMTHTPIRKEHFMKHD
jgi:hypothetical protein